jgi:hypothetical protein
MDQESVTLKGPDGVETIRARTRIWAAGVKASPLAKMLADATGAETDRAGRVSVNLDCTLPGHPEVFAIGDMVSLNRLPGVAQPAIQEGRYVGKVIKARLRGEKEDREFSMRLTQAFPRNSTLWATDPATQLVYLATRRFANLRMPGVLMGFRDPIDDAPVYEHDMGEAQVVVGEPEISMPRPRQPEAPAERIDTETGEVQREEPQEAVPDPSGPQLITPAALRILTQKLQHPALTDRFLQHFGIGALEQLPMTQVNAAFAWIAEQPAPAKE